MLPTIPKSLWRKSSQWVALARPHAMRAVEDTIIRKSIKKHCVYGYDKYLRRWVNICSRDPASCLWHSKIQQSLHCAAAGVLLAGDTVVV